MCRSRSGARWPISTRRRCWLSSSGQSRPISWKPSGTAPASASSTRWPARRSTKGFLRHAGVSGTGGSAETLLAGRGPDPDAVAYHFQQAGDPRAWEWLVRAGDRAQRAYAWLTAAERLRAAAALLVGVADEERTRCWLARRVGWLLRFSDPAGALPAVDDALRTATRLGDALSVAELGWVRSVLFSSIPTRSALAWRRCRT